MNVPIQRAAVIGDGAMGTLCARMLAQRGVATRLWGRDPAHVATLERQRQNHRYLSGYDFPPALSVSADGADVMNAAELIVSAVPCQYLRAVWSTLGKHAPDDVPIVSVAKGIEIDTLLRPTQIIHEFTPQSPAASLSGPNIAGEIAASKPAGAVAASEDESVARLVQRAFSTPDYRVYTNTDLLGVELAGATKNVIAIAAGICDGLEAGSNAKASLVTRGLVEISRLGVALGARPETFQGLAGVGDLITTCISPVGRNRSAGERIGRGMSAEEAIRATQSVIEGIPTTRAVLRLAAEVDVNMPITEAVASVLFDACRPADAIHRLMTRELRAE